MPLCVLISSYIKSQRKEFGDHFRNPLSPPLDCLCFDLAQRELETLCFHFLTFFIAYPMKLSPNHCPQSPAQSQMHICGIIMEFKVSHPRLRSIRERDSGFASCLFIALGRRLLKDSKKTVTATCICIWFSCSLTATSWGGEILQMLSKYQQTVRANLVPDSRLCHNLFRGACAVALPRLVQLPPRVECLLEQEAAAQEVQKQRKPNDDEQLYYD